MSDLDYQHDIDLADTAARSENDDHTPSPLEETLPQEQGNCLRGTNSAKIATPGEAQVVDTSSNPLRAP